MSKENKKRLCENFAGSSKGRLKTEAEYNERMNMLKRGDFSEARKQIGKIIFHDRVVKG